MDQQQRILTILELLSKSKTLEHTPPETKSPPEYRPITVYDCASLYPAGYAGGPMAYEDE